MGESARCKRVYYMLFIQKAVAVKRILRRSIWMSEWLYSSRTILQVLCCKHWQITFKRRKLKTVKKKKQMTVIYNFYGTLSSGTTKFSSIIFCCCKNWNIVLLVKRKFLKVPINFRPHVRTVEEEIQLFAKQERSLYLN